MNEQATINKHTKKQGQLSRADLLYALVSTDHANSSAIAQQIGLQYVDSVKQPESSKPNVENKISPNKEPEIPAQSGKATANFWIVTKQEQYTAEDKKELNKESLTSDIVWENRPTQAPKHHLIAEPKFVLPRIFNHAKIDKNSREIDTEKLVKHISQGKHLTRLPKQQRRRLGQHIHFIDDRKNHLIPYWRDHYYYQAIIASYQPDYSCSHAVCIEGQLLPKTRTKQGLKTWQMPPKESLVIIFSDLGALAQQSERHVKQWLQIGEQLQRQQCTAIVLLPCHPDACDKRLKKYFHLQAWEANQHCKKINQDSQQQAKQLLIALAPVIRLEPSLIRQMRLAMRCFGEKWHSDAAVESILWQHPDIQERHSVAASLNLDARLQNLQHFAKLPEEQRKKALDVIREWRGGDLSHGIWFVEVAALDASTRKLIPNDVQASNTYFCQYNARLQRQPDAVDENEQDWLIRTTDDYIPDYALEHSELGKQLQQIKYELHKHDADYHAEGINPRQLAINENAIKKAVLYQQGNSLRLVPFTPNTRQATIYSPIALLTLRQNHIQLRTESERLGELDLKDQTAIELPSEDKITIISDCETLTLEQWQKPEEIEATGRDEYGLYLDVDFAGITQRFRYIQPSTFMMGSPDNEAERDDDEDYHQVTIPQAYWIADTTVTQELWQAIMGENPSSFKAKDQPVENVSWHDAQDFITKLQQQQPLLSLRLPTEAEWENACRAGSTTAFSFGDNITPQQVNYDGNFPYNNAKKGEYRQQTVKVKSLACNDWGLYEMHGNVWEWCNDIFTEHLGTQAVSDTWQADKNKDALRVLRGGSWNGFGRFCRSAIRRRYVPDLRNDNIGFRLILGHRAASHVKQEPFVVMQDQPRRGAADKPVLQQTAEQEKQ